MARCKPTPTPEVLLPWPSCAASSTARTPGASTATGFSMKTCLPASTAAAKWIGPEARRRGQDHQVDARVDHLLVGVEADELPVLRHVDLG